MNSNILSRCFLTSLRPVLNILENWASSLSRNTNLGRKCALQIQYKFVFKCTYSGENRLNANLRVLTWWALICVKQLYLYVTLSCIMVTFTWKWLSFIGRNFFSFKHMKRFEITKQNLFDIIPLYFSTEF